MIVVDRFKIWSLAAIALILIGLCVFLLTRDDVDTTEFPTVTVNNEKFRVDIADNDYERARGLMYVQGMEDDYGMLFIFPSDVDHGFWMKNTLIPLDMIFLDESLKIVYIENQAMPCKTLSCPSYQPTQKYRYVLEINGGLAKEYGFELGDAVSIDYEASI